MSEDDRHSQGRWRLIVSPDQQHYGVQIGEDGGFILTYNMPNKRANARLIVLAPELYDFVKSHAEHGDMTAGLLLRKLAYGNLM